MLKRLLSPDGDPPAGTDPNANGGGQQPGDGGNTPAPQITLTPAALEQRLERERQKVARELEEKLRGSGRLLSDEEAQALAEQKRKQAEAEAEKARKSVSEDVLQRINLEKQQIKAQAEQREAELTKKLNNQIVNSALSLALASHKYADGVDARHVQKLIWDDNTFAVENDAVLVLDDKGQPQYNDDGTPMTPADYVARRLSTDLAYMLAPVGKPGTGGTTLRSGMKIQLPHNYDDPRVWATLSPAQKEEAARLQGFRNDTSGAITFERKPGA